MGYYDEPAKPIEIREDRPFENHDKAIDYAESYGKYGDRTDAASAEHQICLGMDDIDRMRRRKLRHQSR